MAKDLLPITIWVGIVERKVGCQSVAPDGRAFERAFEGPVLSSRSFVGRESRTATSDLIVTALPSDEVNVLMRKRIVWNRTGTVFFETLN